MGLSSSRLEEKVQSGSSNAGHGKAARPGVPPTTGAAASGTEKKQGSSSSSSSTTKKWVPHKFDEIVDGPAEPAGEQVFKGIYLAEKAKKYWVDKRTNANCFMLFARGIGITWGSDERYWSWHKLKDEAAESSGGTADADEADIEVARLEDVCWLEIRARLEMSHLSPGFTYDVSFLVKLDPNGYGWSEPVELLLNFPDKTPQQKRNENLWKIGGKKGWTELKVGEVKTAAGQQGEMEIAMLRLGGEWKRGLILKAIKIIPKG